MFVNAIETVNKFTRPIHSIVRNYGGLVSPGTSTLFFVNENAEAVTCKHVADLLIHAEHVNVQYQEFKKERDKFPKDQKFKRNLSGLETKYKFNREAIVQIKNMFLGAVDSFTGFSCHTHSNLDLAIIKFHGYKQILYDNYALFVKDSNKIKQGRSLCRIGYPFPEFTNFKYDEKTDDIIWTEDGNINSPLFPLDGILTRFVGENNNIHSIEMSTPGLRGQSGGPLFDQQGLIYGMQYQTGHLHLGFDIKEMPIVSDGKKSKVSNYPFLHVGHCIHVDKIREFLTAHNVKYYER